MVLVKHAVYGPVPSWRFGVSLGIDPTLPPKKCSLNCIYCQVGRTKYHLDYLDTAASSIDMLTPSDLRDSLEAYIPDLNISDIDIVIFSGSGEPSLNAQLSELIDVVRSVLPDKPVGILSNGTLIDHEKVRQAYLKLDMVTLKLDAASQELFQTINRPHPFTPPIRELIEYYHIFRMNYPGFLGIEVMALEYKGISNISGQHAEALLNALTYISPDVIELEVPSRPPSNSMVSVPDQQTIDAFVKILHRKFGEGRVWTYGDHKTSKVAKIFTSDDFIENRIESIVAHRPCTINDFCSLFDKDKEDMQVILDKLLANRRIASKDYENQEYYVPTSDQTA